MLQYFEIQAEEIWVFQSYDSEIEVVEPIYS